MPQVADPIPYVREPAPNCVRWTRSQCEAIRDAGVLTGRYELVDGEVLSEAGQKPSHSVVIGYVMQWLVNVFGAPFVRIQSTIDVSDADPEHNEPEPDAAVTAQPNEAFAHRHPGAADLLLVVEVSDSTLRFDRTTRAALYGRAGISEYWVVDIAGRQLFVHRSPSDSGYKEVTLYGSDEQVATLARPNEIVRVADLLPAP